MTRPVRVLLVEDSPDDAELILVELRRAGFEPTSRRIETLQEMRAALTSEPWDIILSDYNLPELSAVTVLALARELAPHVPFIVVSGTIGEELAVETMRTGASDYVLKHSLTRLAPAVERELREAENRKERQRAVAERDALLRRLQLQVERMPIGLIVTAPDLTLTDWNPAAERIFGFRRAEVLGKTCFDLFIPPDERARVAGILHRLLAGDMTAHSVNTNRTQDGKIITCEWYNTPLVAPGGGVEGILSMVMDVTDRVRAEEALQLRDRALRAVTPGILITDPNQPDNPIIYASPGFERLTGYSPEEVLGKNCRFLQGKDTHRPTVAQVHTAITNGQACEVELLNYRKDGTPFWNALSISPVRDEMGRLTHFVGVQTDVTERRRLEEQFRQAQKMEAVGRLAGGVAHDFNNLLTVITGYGDLLLSTLPPSEPAREMVREIRNAGERAAGLTRQLLAFSRKTVLDPKVLDLNAVLEDMAKLVRRLIGEDIELATAFAPDLGRVQVDPGQLEQAVINLCVNARDAMPRGGKITIETQNVELDEAYARGRSEVQPGSYVLLSVTDTGHGMDAATKARIFEPFFTTKEQGQGTGLGLAMVYGFVKQSQGHIAVYSEPGQGTTFKVYLPRVAVAVSLSKSQPGLRRMPHGTETLLLTEDESGVRALARHVLQACGYTVLEAADGPEALQVAEQHTGPLHLLVTDVVMPHLGGRQVAEGVVARHPEARILYLSGYTDDAVVRHGILEANANFLQKPFTPASLAQKVREILDQPGSGT